MPVDPRTQMENPSFDAGMTGCIPALIFAAFALILGTAEAMKHSLGYLNMQLLFALPAHPAAFFEYLAEGFGATLIFPAIHIAVASCFKSQRSSRKRWNILLGWSIVMTLLAVLRLKG